MTNQTVFYKVVSAFDDVLTSCIIQPYAGGIKYKVGEWVKPEIEGSKLFVFSTLHNAQCFRSENSSQLIYECEVVNPTEPPQAVVHHLALYRDLVEEFWSGKRLPTCRQSDYIISGTMLCDAVKLTRLV